MNSRLAVIGVLVGTVMLGGCSALVRAPAGDGHGRQTAVSTFPAAQAEASCERPQTDLAELQQDVAAVLDRLGSNQEGEPYADAAAGTDPDDLAIAIVLVDGRMLGAGATAARFPLMSVSKPFTYALAIEQRGAHYMLERIGVSATGLPYNALAAGAIRRTSEQNPMVNAGAIATHSYLEGADAPAKLRAVVDLYSRMANRPLAIEAAWRASPHALTYALAYQMQSVERLTGDVEDVVSRYLESNIVGVTVVDLAQMGATLANGGIQPVTGQRVLQPETVSIVLSAMVIAGMYEDSGSWWVRVGVPAKSGVSGAIMAVLPGWGSIVVYSPRLDAAGNSVRSAIAIEELVERRGLHSMERLLRGRCPG